MLTVPPVRIVSGCVVPLTLIVPAGAVMRDCGVGVHGVRVGAGGCHADVHERGWVGVDGRRRHPRDLLQPKEGAPGGVHQAADVDGRVVAGKGRICGDLNERGERCWLACSMTTWPWMRFETLTVWLRKPSCDASMSRL